MIKAVATAIVLIAGAAVILWFGNTLNSWVLGGLIGGLAAILLSIPITLILFSFFSRRSHEQHPNDELPSVMIQEEKALTQTGTYMLPQARSTRAVPGKEEMYEDEEYEYEEELEENQAYGSGVMIMEERPYGRSRSAHTVWNDERETPLPPAHFLPPPATTRESMAKRGLPPPRTPITQHTLEDGRGRQLSVRGKKETASRRVPLRPSVPPTDPLRNHYRSQALRVARQEARQAEEENVQFSQLPPRRPSTRTGHSRSTYGEQDEDQYSSSTPESTYGYPRRPQKVVDSFPPQPKLRRPTSSQDDDEVHRPLVRRAPYTYEDDLLRQELAQHVDPPAVRRTSRDLKRRNRDNTY